MSESPESTSRNSFLSSHLLWILAAILFVGNFFLLIFSGSSAEADPNLVDQQLTEDEQAFEGLSFWQRLLQKNAADLPVAYSAFDGRTVDPDTEEKLVSVMIDNFSLARPQHSGIRSASMVYEALVEGGITRLMLLFPYQDLETVGPVRSARDYFVDIAEEYGGLYVHAGGSPTALDRLWNSDRVYSVEEDEREEGETYSFRDDDYEAPHNLFFNLLLTREWAKKKNYEFEELKHDWCFSDTNGDDTIMRMNANDTNGLNSYHSDPFVDSHKVSLVKLNFSHDISSSYFVQFQYDLAQNAYRRYYGAQQRSPHIDHLDDLQIAPTNLIVQVAPSYLIEGDEKERLELDNLGTGTAFFYMKGEKIEGIWKKLSSNSATQFFDDLGNPICLQPGQTWISIIDDESLVEEI